MSKLLMSITLVSLVALTFMAIQFPVTSTALAFDKTCELLESGPVLAACTKLVVEMKAKLSDAISPASRLECCGRHYMIECMRIFYQRCGTWNQTAVMEQIDANDDLDVTGCPLPDTVLSSVLCTEDWLWVWSFWVGVLILVVLVQVVRRQCLFV